MDGPKHAGKTTILDRVVSQLADYGLTVLRTKEPTARFDLGNEETFTGVELARLLAADRSDHLERPYKRQHLAKYLERTLIVR